MERKIVPTADGRQAMLYKGKQECWFFYPEEAQHSLDGHTGPEALDLILGVEGATHRLPLHFEFGKNTFINKELRQWLDDSCV